MAQNEVNKQDQKKHEIIFDVFYYLNPNKKATFHNIKNTVQTFLDRLLLSSKQSSSSVMSPYSLFISFELAGGNFLL
jgi:hypothetical protein